MSESTLDTTADTTAGRGAVSGWAREVLPDRAGRRPLLAAGTAMVASPLAMTAWFLVEPSVLPREEPRVFLESVATSPDRYLVATALVALAAALAVPAAYGAARLLRPRLPRLGTAIGVLLFLSGIGLAAQVGFRAFVWSLVDPGAVPASSVESYALFRSGGLFDVLVAPGLVFGGLATLLLVGSLALTRLAPLWVPAALLAGMVLASGEFPDVVTVCGAALGAAANLRLARILLSRG